MVWYLTRSNHVFRANASDNLTFILESNTCVKIEDKAKETIAEYINILCFPC
jgi:hypothetical protein